jgi:CPA2 family monovalent cation:H+ antiporter-2
LAIFGRIGCGPNTPGFVANKHLADQLAEVGVILLMFGVGLQFHLKELLEVRRIAIPGALGQVLVATVLGYLIGVWMDWSWSAGTVFGLAISVASTVVLLRVLSDNNDLHTPTGHIAVGWLVVEDLFTVLVLVLLPVVFGSGDAASATFHLHWLWRWRNWDSGGFTLVAGGRLIPWVLGHVARTNSRSCSR